MNLSSSLTATLALSILIAGLARDLRADSPSGWYQTGTNTRDYEIGLDSNVSLTGRASAYIKALATPRGFSTLMQFFRADLYRGRRVRFSAHVKSVDVKVRAALWMRVDGETPPVLPGKRPGPIVLVADQMGNRPIKGTTDWTRYEIVLDVPQNALNITIGMILDGRGEIWGDNLEFDVVDASVPVTAAPHKEQLPKQPVNLDFEER